MAGQCEGIEGVLWVVDGASVTYTPIEETALLRKVTV